MPGWRVQNNSAGKETLAFSGADCILLTTELAERLGIPATPCSCCEASWLAASSMQAAVGCGAVATSGSNRTGRSVQTSLWAQYVYFRADRVLLLQVFCASVRNGQPRTHKQHSSWCSNCRTWRSSKAMPSPTQTQSAAQSLLSSPHQHRVSVRGWVLCGVEAEPGTPATW